MAVLNDTTEPSPTVSAIYAAYERRQESWYSRRLGASVIGRECARQLWYQFRWTGRPLFKGQKLRLFNTGHLEEPRIVDDLRAIGCEVHDVDPDTGKQFTFTEVDGHFVCKIDAALRGIPEAPKAWHAAEFKTCNDKSFKRVQSMGVAKAKPEHFAQLLMGMATSKMKRGLYVAVNKNTDEIYTERIRIDDHWDTVDSLRLKARKVVMAKVPPAKISESPDYFACNWCDFHDHCHGDKVPDTTCRTCCHVTPIMEGAESSRVQGRWRCDRHSKALQPDEQERACADHLFIPLTINYATVDDSGYDPDGTGWIRYRHRDGQLFTNSKREHEYESRELSELPAPLVGAGIVDAVKGVFGDADVVSVSQREAADTKGDAQ